ncbi:hypothetical protein Dhaf_0463 [Desulfitobacterium hafniense DCB-2]|uniref:Uncharacterized protein n=1 Tax=Desulfitobacterium hafniense (strain DSM 10664 / DCB-2) TaxID=272564 RepID=B8G207_DESHD|nr:hypothetical protein Dhaf_0463 [Desulfitobacterium hafniense DCB-2]
MNFIMQKVCQRLQELNCARVIKDFRLKTVNTP